MAICWQEQSLILGTESYLYTHRQMPSVSGHLHMHLFYGILLKYFFKNKSKNPFSTLSQMTALYEIVSWRKVSIFSFYIIAILCWCSHNFEADDFTLCFGFPSTPSNRWLFPDIFSYSLAKLKLLAISLWRKAMFQSQG